MREVNREQVIEHLQAVGIAQGDGLLCHSAIQFFGRPVGGVGMYLDAIQAVIGREGTLAVPTFNFGFARGEPYDPQETPSQGMGAFSEYVRQHPEAKRTSHPMQSLAVIGCHAVDLASRDTLSAFDPGSAFERMLELDFKLLLLGADVSATSIYHISEQRNQVPYRYWKDFNGLVHGEDGWHERTYRMYVRDLDLDPITTAGPVQRLLQERGQWRSVTLNYGKIASCRLLDFVASVDHFLTADPWSLVLNRP
jgi:aminoglycoside 3-N-acetyltransferase